MAISVNWATKVINVPQADLTPLGGGVYELDVNVFRLALKDLEDDEAGIPFLTTHNHFPEVTVGGVTLARVVEIINGYTVLFQDVGSPYAVKLVGANNNIADVKVVNQVSLLSANSAGLISSGGGGGTDWTSTERAQIRHRLGIDGAASAPAATPSLAEPGDAMSLVDGAITDAKIAADVRRYQAKVWMVHDGTANADRYTVVFFKDGEPITTGITSPAISVVKMYDGSILLNASLTNVASSGLFKRDEYTNKMQMGEAYVVHVTATIGGVPMEWYQPLHVRK